MTKSKSVVIEESKPEGKSVLYKEPTAFVSSGNRFDVPIFGSSASAWSKPAISASYKVPNEDPDLKSFDAILNQLSPIDLPEHYCLGQSSFSFQRSKLATILERLTSFIKRTSTDFKIYPNEGRVDCKPQGMVSFRIMLWSQLNGTIVLEIQRQTGCSLLLQRYRRILTRFLSEGIEFDPDSLAPSLPKLKIAAKELSRTDSTEGAQCQTTLKRCCELLRDCNQESKLLALENLVFLQSECCTSAMIADETARNVLGLYGDAENRSLQTSFAFCFGVKHTDAHRIPSMMNESKYSQGKYFGMIHHMALKVLAVALDRVTKSPSSFCKLNIKSESWKTILEALWYNVLHSFTEPQEAALSAHCLVRLDEMGSHHEALRYLLHSKNSQQMLPTIYEAQVFASKNNSKLEKCLRDLSDRIQMAI